MAIRKRGNFYQIDYFDPTGKRIRKSFKKKKEAEAELGKRVSLIAENPQRYLEVAKVSITTIDELIEKYEKNFKHQRSFKNSKNHFIENIQKEFKDRLLSSITYYDVENYRNKLKNTLTKHGTIRKDSTVNRSMACLRHMITKAVEWDMIERNPFDKGQKLYLKENNERVRYLSEDEIIHLLSECPEPLQPKLIRMKNGVLQGRQAIHLKDFIIIAINTGMRKTEILSLKWSQIKNGFIYLEKTKTDKKREIPINNDLENCLKDIRKRQQLTSEYVFPNDKGGYIRDIKTAFTSALDRAGIEDFRPHDLRHTFASHYLMRGGSLKPLSEILGHADIKMTMRYAHLSREFSKEEIQNLNGLTSGSEKQNCHKSVTILDSEKAKNR